jgi:hypothetical protein
MSNLYIDTAIRERDEERAERKRVSDELDFANRILRMFRATLTGVTHCHNCSTCQQNAAETLDAELLLNAAERQKRERAGYPAV